jgi:hypothetical protein
MTRFYRISRKTAIGGRSFNLSSQATGEPICNQQLGLGEEIGSVTQGAAMITDSTVPVAASLLSSVADPAPRTIVYGNSTLIR